MLEKIELARRAMPDGVDLVELFAEGRSLPPYFRELLAEDVEVEFLPDTEGENEYRGVEGLLEGWRDWLSPWQSYVLTVDEMIEAGDNDLLVTVRVKARTSRDGVEIEHAPASIWTIDGDKVTRVRFYLDRAEAYREAGI